MRTLILLLLIAGCTNDPKPTPTGATCPDVDNPQYTWQNYGYDFMCHYCVNCHDSTLKLNQRNGAPLFHDLDTLFGAEMQARRDRLAQWIEIIKEDVRLHGDPVRLARRSSHQCRVRTTRTRRRPR